jgi:hypothetical protein
MLRILIKILNITSSGLIEVLRIGEGLFGLLRIAKTKWNWAGLRS